MNSFFIEIFQQLALIITPQEADRAAADRGGDKRTSVEMDWPHLEENRRACGQGSPRIEPTGEAGKRGRPRHTWRRTRMFELGERGTYVARGKSYCPK